LVIVKGAGREGQRTTEQGLSGNEESLNMGRRLPEDFEGRALAGLAVAARTGDANKIEHVLNTEGIEYTFELTELVQPSVFGILFGAVKEGIIFLVPTENYDFCKTILTDAGLSHLLADEQQPS
jgi:hypothetical protein